MIDIGMVGTEMLYWTVGSRELDGGLMCTASHNPKAYTGAKLVGAALSPCPATRGIGELRDIVIAGEPGEPAAEPGEYSTEDVGRAVPRRDAPSSIDPAAVKPMKVVLDGGNGMAGPDVRPDARLAPDRAGADLLGARRRVPRPRAQPAARGEPRASSSTRCSPRAADLGIAWDGDADRCFFIDDTGEFVDGDFLTALLAQSDPGEGPRRR